MYIQYEYACVCVHVCVRACMRACVRSCVRVCRRIAFDDTLRIHGLGIAAYTSVCTYAQVLYVHKYCMCMFMPCKFN